jgi:hypothetical protein
LTYGVPRALRALILSFVFLLRAAWLFFLPCAPTLKIYAI